MSANQWGLLEQRRLALQSELDGQKNQRARNQLGQFATPTDLARHILAYGTSLLPAGEPIRFLDPAIGTGSFFSALMNTAPERMQSAVGYEIDAHYGLPARELWSDSGLDLRMGDFTEAKVRSSERANLLICNPPYVRHHHMPKERKAELQVASELACGVRVQGLAGLYCYFMALSHPWMEEGGIAGWLIPSEFMDVNYGVGIKRYLTSKVTLLRIHRFCPNDVQFSDALVSSAVVWLRNEPPPPDHQVEFTFGGSLFAPQVARSIPLAELNPSDKWTQYPHRAVTERLAGVTVGDLFQIRRGIATGDNSFFVMSPERASELNLPTEFLKPILPSTRYVAEDEIMADQDGVPRLSRQLVLLDCRMKEDEVRQRYPDLWAYLQTGTKGEGSVSERYLCRTRKPWYSQEERAPAPLLCTYMGRSDREGRRPFRFFLNHSRAIAGNVYLMLYPKPTLQAQIQRHPGLLRSIWQYLNQLEPSVLLGEGRVYGGGLHKLEPKELAKVQLSGVTEVLPNLSVEQDQQLSLTLRVA